MDRIAYYRPAAWIEVEGEDASEFLQSQFSNDLRVADGSAVYGLWLDVKGKVQADATVLRVSSTRYLVHSVYSPAVTIAGRLENHIIADDVSCAPAAAAGLCVISDACAGIAASLGLEVPEPGRHTGTAGGYVFAGLRAAQPSLEAVFPGARAPDAVAEAVEALVRRGDLTIVSEDELHALRVAAGIAAVPLDLGPGDLPAEGGFEERAVSFTKGCFLGQEVVARMHHLGRPRRGLYRVGGAGSAPETPAALTAARGSAAGDLRSAAPGPEGWLGIAMLKHSAATQPLALEAGGEPVAVAGPIG